MTGRLLTAAERAAIAARLARAQSFTPTGADPNPARSFHFNLARQDVPALLAHADAAEARIAELEEALADARNLVRILGRYVATRPYGWVEGIAPDA